MKMPYVLSKSKQADLTLTPEVNLVEDPSPLSISEMKKSPKEEEKLQKILPNKPEIKSSQAADPQKQTKRGAFQ